jgi:thymidylate synthase
MMDLAVHDLRAGRDATAPIARLEDVVGNSKDFPCTNAFHFFVRDGRLNMTGEMRSQSVAMVMPYDVFSATMIQEMVARELGVELGNYHHTATSFHYYHDEQGVIDKVLEEAPFGGPPMPAISGDVTLANPAAIVEFEAAFREAALAEDLDVSKALDHARDLGDYWGQMARILMMKVVEGDQRAMVVQELDEMYRPFFDGSRSG